MSPRHPQKGTRLQAGGSIGEEAVYVERRADNELTMALREGEICHVLAPRQMGKSSLCGRAARQLRKEGLTCVQLDLNLLGGQKSVPDIGSWFYSLIKELSRQLGFSREFTEELWQKEAHTTATYKWSHFLQEEVPKRIAGPAVFIFDEIDTILSLPFSCDDFFAVVRAMYNARPERPELRRIAVCFVGVAAPGELMLDPDRTPLNVGTAIKLEDFNKEEVSGFAKPMEQVASNPADYLDVIYDWTAGHPYMTHKLCVEVCRRRPPHELPVARVEELVRRHFLQTGRTQESNLQYAERRIDSRQDRGALLRLYRRVLEGQSVPADRNDRLQSELCLSGICRWHEGCLVPRNRIFAIVFDWPWVQGKESARLLDDALERWRDGGKRPDLLLAGAELQMARDWAEDRNDISVEEQEFLLLSMEAERAKTIRRSLQIAVSSLAAALGICVAIFIWQLRNLQNQNAAETRLRQRAEESEWRQKRDAEELRRQRDELAAARAELEEKNRRLKLSEARTEEDLVELRRVTRQCKAAEGLLRRQTTLDIQDAEARASQLERDQIEWERLAKKASEEPQSPELRAFQEAFARPDPQPPPSVADPSGNKPTALSKRRGNRR
jgi:hypothetical protein